MLTHGNLFDSGICQNPPLASSLLITVAPVSCANVSSTPGLSENTFIERFQVNTNTNITRFFGNHHRPSTSASWLIYFRYYSKLLHTCQLLFNLYAEWYWNISCSIESIRFGIWFQLDLVVSFESAQALK